MGEAGQGVRWPDEVDPAAFSGSWRIVAVLTGAGLLVGVIHRLDPMAREENAFVALGTGRIDPRPVPGGVLISAVSLIGGFSLGPEVPTGMAAAGIATWWGRRRGRSESQVHADTTAAITGAWGGLFTTPFVGTLLNVGMSVGARILDWRRIAADATAAVVPGSGKTTVGKGPTGRCNWSGPFFRFGTGDTLLRSRRRDVSSKKLGRLGRRGLR